jgi:hypothetical protein
VRDGREAVRLTDCCAVGTAQVRAHQLIRVQVADQREAEALDELWVSARVGGEAGGMIGA